MKKILLTFFLFSCIYCTIYAQATFQKTFSLSTQDEGRCVRTTNDGGYIVAGTKAQSGIFHSTLIKFDCTGNVQWSKQYGEPSAYHHYGSAVEQTKDSGFVMTGMYRAGGSGQIYLLKTDKSGNILWFKTFEQQEAWKVKQTFDEGYIIIGNISNSAIHLIKTDKNGNLQWTKTFGQASVQMEGYDVKQTSDSGYVAIGKRNQGGEDAFVIKTDKTGSLQWVKSYNIDAIDKGFSILQLASGEFILEGYSYNGNASNCNNFIIKTNASGSPLWSKSYPLNNLNTGWPGFWSEIQQTHDGNFIFGYEFGVGINYTTFLTKVDNAGAIRWSKSYGDKYLHSLAITPDNGIVFTGWNSANDVYLVKTDSAGNSGCGQTNLNATSSTVSVTVTTPTITVSTSTILATPAMTTYTPAITSTSICSNNLVPAVSISISNSTICQGNSVTVSVTGGFSYEWSTGATTSSISASPTSSTTYSVTVNRGCTDTTMSAHVTVSPCTGINSTEEVNSLIKIFPNPISEKLIVQLPIIYNHTIEIKLYSPDGKLLRTTSSNKSEISISTYELSSGIYFISIQTEQGLIFRKLIKE